MNEDGRVILPQCYRCEHYIGMFICKAFRDDIPDDIFKNYSDHTKPYPGDNGIRFEPIKEANA